MPRNTILMDWSFLASFLWWLEFYLHVPPLPFLRVAVVGTGKLDLGNPWPIKAKPGDLSFEERWTYVYLQIHRRRLICQGTRLWIIVEFVYDWSRNAGHGKESTSQCAKTIAGFLFSHLITRCWIEGCIHFQWSIRYKTSPILKAEQPR